MYKKIIMSLETEINHCHHQRKVEKKEVKYHQTNFQNRTIASHIAVYRLVHVNFRHVQRDTCPNASA